MFSKSPQFDKLLDKATSPQTLETEWSFILGLCDLIRQGDCPPKHALNCVKKKLTSPCAHTAVQALAVLDSLSKNCGHLIHDEMATAEFMDELRDVARRNPDETFRSKLLELLQSWSSAFKSNPKYQAVQDTVTAMKAEGFKFPASKESDAMFATETAPKWVNGDVCSRCRVQFTLLLRKHHCRACGKVFCHSCANKFSPLPNLGIEKFVRTCEACFEAQKNKHRSSSPHVNHEVESLPAEYLTSSLAHQSQVPKSKKTADDLREEEEFELALALSRSEAEAKEEEKKRATIEILGSSTSKGKAPAMMSNDEEDEDPELERYLNRSLWEKKQAEEKAASEKKMLSPDHFRISPAGPPSAPTTPTHQLENGDVSELELNEFVTYLKTQVEIFVNRMKSNSSRGRSISNDSSVQTLFMNVTKDHSRLLTYIHQQDDSRVYYERLQDKLAQVKDAMMALDALREEHREKIRREAEEAERLRQMQMAQKLEIMRRRKQEFLQYQRQLAIQKMQEQEREMQMRQEQQKQQYLMGNIGMPPHVAWDPSIPTLPPGQYGPQYQSMPGGYIPQPAPYPIPGAATGITQQPTSMPIPASIPPGMIPPVIAGQIPVQHQDQPPRVPAQALPQPPRMMPPQQQQQPQPPPPGVAPIPTSNMPQMHPPQIPSSNFQGMPLPGGAPMLTQTRSLVMAPPGAGPVVVPPPGSMNLPPPPPGAGMNMPPPPQVAGMKQRLGQGVPMAPMPGPPGMPPHGVMMPPPPPPQQQQQQPQPPPPVALPPGIPVPMAPPQQQPPPAAMAMMQPGSAANGQPAMAPPQQTPSLTQTQQQPQPQPPPPPPPQQAPAEESESKTAELIRFD